MLAHPNVLSYLDRDHKDVQATKGQCTGFYVGGNLTCWWHIAACHYNKYAARWVQLGVKAKKAAIPNNVLKAQQAEVNMAEGKAGAQMTLNAVLEKVQSRILFSLDAILDAVTKLIVCGNQVSTVSSQTLNEC